MVKRFLLLLLCICCIGDPAFADATSATDYQIKLDNIRKKITEVLNRLNEDQNKRSNLRSELQKLERKIAKVSKSLRYTQRKHKKATKDLKSLKSELKTLNRQLREQREQLSSQLRSAYAMGNQAQIKLVLNQQKPAEMGRAMVYYDYLNRARTQEIETYLDSIQRKKALEADITATTQNLEKLVKKRTKQKKSLTKARKSRKSLLVKLDSTHPLQ